MKECVRWAKPKTLLLSMIESQNTKTKKKHRREKPVTTSDQLQYE